MELNSYFPLNSALQSCSAEDHLKYVLEAVKLKKNPSVHLAYAVDYLNRSNKPRQAHELILYFCDLFPAESSFLFASAFQNIFLRYFDHADTLLDRLAKKNTQLPISALKAEGYFLRGEFNKCHLLFQTIPSSLLNSESYLCWIRALLCIENLDEALQIASEAYEKFPENDSCQPLLLECLIRSNKFISAYCLLIKIDSETTPVNLDLLVRLASVLFFADAEEYCRNLLFLIDGWLPMTPKPLSVFTQNCLMHLRLSLHEPFKPLLKTSQVDYASFHADQVLAINTLGMDLISTLLLCVALNHDVPTTDRNVMIISRYSSVLNDVFPGFSFTSSPKLALIFISKGSIYNGFDLLMNLSIDRTILCELKILLLQFISFYNQAPTPQASPTFSSNCDGTLFIVKPSSTELERLQMISTVRSNGYEISDHFIQTTIYPFEISQNLSYKYLVADNLVISKTILIDELVAIVKSTSVLTSSEFVALLALILQKPTGLLVSQSTPIVHFLLNWMQSDSIDNVNESNQDPWDLNLLIYVG